MAELAVTGEESKSTKLEDSSFFVNRELSWLEFNYRVLEEAQDQLTPIIEKLKFTSIFSSNMDEFFMVRVGSLFRAFAAGINEHDSSGRTIRQQLDEIADKVRTLVNEQYKGITKEIIPSLREANIFIHRMEELDENETKRLDKYFEVQVFPVLTPLAVDAGHPFPFLSNLRLNLMVIFKESNNVNAPQPHAFDGGTVSGELAFVVPVPSKSSNYQVTYEHGTTGTYNIIYLQR